MLSIDFGTYNTVAVSYINGRYVFIRDVNQKYYIPSLLSLNGDGKIGAVCRELIGTNIGEEVLTNMKAYLTVQCEEQLELLKNMNPKLNITLQNGVIMIEGKPLLECLEEFIGKVKKLAEDQLKCTFTQVAYSYPVDFDQLLLSSMDKVMHNIGFTDIVKISEPLAAVTTYIEENKIMEGKILVVDMGGGTCDLGIVSCNGKNSFVLYKNGNNRLGGIYIDEMIFDWLIEQINLKYPALSSSVTKSVKQVIKNACTEIKESLSQTNTVIIPLSSFFNLNEDDVSMCLTLHRKDFEHIISKFVSEFIQFVETTIIKGEKSNDPFDVLAKTFTHVIFVGGSSVIPILRQRMKILFPTQIYFDIDPRTVVAKGNYIFACQVMKKSEDSQYPVKLRKKNFRVRHHSANNIPNITSHILGDILTEPIGLLSCDGSSFRVLDENTKYEEVKDYEISVKFDHQKKIQLFFCQGADPVFTNNKYLGVVEYIIPSGGRLLNEPQFLIKVFVSYCSDLTVIFEDLKEKKQLDFTIATSSKGELNASQSAMISPVDSKVPTTEVSLINSQAKPDASLEETYEKLVNDVENRIMSNIEENISLFSELEMIKLDHEKDSRPISLLIEELQKLI